MLGVDWVWRRLAPRAWSGVAESWLFRQRACLHTADRLRRQGLDLTLIQLGALSRFGEPWPMGSARLLLA